MTDKLQQADIKHDPRNARKHTPRNVGMIESSIQRNGFGRSILLANDGTVIAGNATMDAAASAGLDDVLALPAIYALRAWDERRGIVAYDDLQRSGATA